MNEPNRQDAPKKCAMYARGAWVVAEHPGIQVLLAGVRSESRAFDVIEHLVGASRRASADNKS